MQKSRSNPDPDDATQSLQARATVLFRPQVRSSSKLVSYRLAGLDICLTCTYPTCPGNPKGFGEENLVPGHGQDVNTLLCTARNEPKIALSNDWPRRHFVKNVGSYKMIRPTKNAFYKMAWFTRQNSRQNASVWYKNVL